MVVDLMLSAVALVFATFFSTGTKKPARSKVVK